jgi:hypothetical protein
MAVPTYEILLVSPRSEDHASLKTIFCGSRWQLREAWTLTEGQRIIRRHHARIPVVICEHRWPDGDWKMLLESGLAAARPSYIVCSRLADERLWMEVLNLGAHDLLRCAPFKPQEVLQATESAFAARAGALTGNVAKSYAASNSN